MKRKIIYVLIAVLMLNACSESILDVKNENSYDGNSFFTNAITAKEASTAMYSPLLFQGMFERNMLTFNPGWDSNAQNLDSYTDVRELQRLLKAQGVVFVSEADEQTTGPANFIVVDPDGNPVLFDQHV